MFFVVSGVVSCVNVMCVVMSVVVFVCGMCMIGKLSYVVMCLSVNWLVGLIVVYVFLYVWVSMCWFVLVGLLFGVGYIWYIGNCIVSLLSMCWIVIWLMLCVVGDVCVILCSNCVICVCLMVSWCISMCCLLLSVFCVNVCVEFDMVV